MNPGAAFGAFTVVEPLGRGAMGEVYRARDTRLGRDVAIKLLPEAFALDTDRLRRFEREAQAADGRRIVGKFTNNGFIEWSPDANQIAAVSLPGNLDGSLWVVDANGARFRKLFDVPTDQFARGMCWLRDGSAILLGSVASSGDIYLAERAPK